MPAETGRAVHAEKGSTQKVCQLVGEFDRQIGRPTVNATESRYGFWGTDLGASFEHEGKLYFLFGDTHPIGGLPRPPDSDSIAFTEDPDPESCIRLTFLTDPDGGFRPLLVPGVYTGAFAVPTGGFSTGDRMYMLATSDYPGRGPMGRSILARSDDDGQNFRYLYDLSTAKFINVSPTPVAPGAVPGLPEPAERGILLWGTGIHRESSPHLAYLPVSDVENRAALRFFAGVDRETGNPLWSQEEAAAVALFDQPCMGEFSAGWNPYLRKWMLLYNCGKLRGQIQLRTADLPWGPWSEPEILFDPQRSQAACGFLNPTPQPVPVPVSAGPCRVVADPHNPWDLGDSYGPYLISRFTKGEAGRRSTIYFVMSTWNPYTVVLMKATLRMHQDSQVAAWPSP